MSPDYDSVDMAELEKEMKGAGALADKVQEVFSGENSGVCIHALAMLFANAISYQGRADMDKEQAFEAICELIKSYMEAMDISKGVSLPKRKLQ